MKNSSIIAQVTSLVVSLIIIFIFIVPKFGDIQIVQDDIAAYEAQIANINQVTAQLQSLNNQLDAISATDQRALMTFLPDQVDTLMVVRTIQNIIAQSSVQPVSLNYNSSSQLGERTVQQHTFQFDVSGEYSQIVNFLRNMEQNEYLFDFTSVELAVDEVGIVSLSGEVATYSLVPNVI